MAEVEFRNNPAAFRYEAILDEVLASQIDYLIEGDVVSLTHSGTPTQYRGRGLASGLAKFALDEIRASGRKVVPLCPYVASYIADNPQYADLVSRS